MTKEDLLLGSQAEYAKVLEDQAKEITALAAKVRLLANRHDALLTRRGQIGHGTFSFYLRDGLRSISSVQFNAEECAEFIDAALAMLRGRIEAAVKELEQLKKEI